MDSGHSSLTPRRIIEKNRRNNMKNLYTKLFSLLPDQGSQEMQPLPDQIDETVKYIKCMQAKLERSKKKKESLLGRGTKRSRSCMSTTSEITSTSKSPHIEIHELMTSLDATLLLINGVDNHSIFYDTIHLLRQEGADIFHANFSISGNSTIQIFHHHHKNGVSSFNTSGATPTISERLKEMMKGSTREEVESELDIWDFEIQTDAWDFQISK